jgi:flagellar protein FliO/FliZ
MQSPYTFFFAFIVVLALIGLTAWLVRRFGGNRLGANASRGRMPRLAVIDAAAVDGRRRLVLVRRDNIEHLLMIGGPTDIVVEQNIVRAIPARDQTPSRSGAGGAELTRAPLPDPTSWSDGEAADPPEPAMPEPPPRPARPSFVDEVRRPAPASERRGGDLPGFAAPEPPLRPEPRLEPRGEQTAVRSARSEPLIPRPARSEAPKAPPVRNPERAAPPAPPSAAAAAASPAASSADQNLAEMAQRLEAALRRPGGEPAEPRVGAPPMQAEAPIARPRGEVAAPPAAPPPPKGGFENLEDEMASLLGRPKSPS